MSTANAEQNLLFGFIALQNGLLSREDLIAATSAWLHDKSQSLEELLVARGLLSDDDCEMLAPLVRRHLAQHEGDAERSLASIDAVSSIREELRALGDPDLEASLVHATQARRADGEVTRTIAWSSSPDARYQVLRPLAKGGLGLVSVALDEELKREVAFKEIQREYAHDSDSRARFVREAEITGGLEHPGIVPVYGLGQYDDGRPYYAMRMVKGENLRDEIKQYHNTTSRHLHVGERSLALRQLLARFIDVCNAVEYAHSRGILHRDIKPANIMLGKYGETLVVDWGLAKAIGRSEEHRGKGEETLQPMSADSSSHTRMGSAIGTPSFMSPEQAAGRLASLGPTSDVYSLGATLYCILTGKPPLHESDAGTAIRKAQAGEFPRPREVKQDVPRALEAVCLKAMATEAKDRYSSAIAVSADVECWLADEPVTAYSDSFVERAARFNRRHRSWVQAGAIASLLITACSVIAAVYTNTLRRRAETQLTVSTVARLAAQAQADRKDLPVRSLRFAMEAVESTRRHDGTTLPVAHEALLNVTQDVGGVPLVGHEYRVYRVLISPDGHRVVTTSHDGIRLWDLTSADPSVASIVLEGLQGRHEVAISGDGRWLVLGWASDPRVWMWDLTVDQPATPMILEGHSAGITSVATSADGHWLFTGSADTTVRVWDLTTTPSSFTALKHQTSVSSLASDGFGRRLAVVCADRTGAVWDLGSDPDDASAAKLDVPSEGISWLAISPSGDKLATSSGDTLRLWDLKGREAGLSSRVLHEHNGGLFRRPVFSQDGRWLVIGSHEGVGWLWDLGTKDPTAPFVLRGHEYIVTSIAISEDARWLVTGGHDFTARLWDLHERDPSASPLVLRGHEDTVDSVAIGPNSRWLVTGSWDGTARLWDLTSENPASALAFVSEGPNVGPLEMSPDGRWLVNTAKDNSFHLLEFGATGKDPVLSNVLRGFEGKVRSTFLSNRHFVAGNRQGRAYVWDLMNATAAPRVFQVNGKLMIGALISTNERWLATFDDDITAELWNLSTPDPPLPLRLPGYRRHGGFHSPIAMSPDSQWLATCDGTVVRLLDLTNEKPLKSPGVLPHVETSQLDRSAEGEVIGRLAFSPDSNLLVAQHNRGLVAVWNLDDKAPEQKWRILQGHRGFPYAVAFDTDCRRLVTASFDHTARLWDLASEHPSPSSTVLGSPTGAVYAAAFSPNGRWVATGGHDKMVRLWDLLSGDFDTPALVLRGHLRMVNGIAFSKDSRWVITRDNFQSIRLWDLDIDRLLERANKLAGGKLTSQERRKLGVEVAR